MGGKMNSEVWKKMVRNGSLLMVFCFSLSLFFGVMAQAYIPSSQTNAFPSNFHPKNIDTEKFSIGFGTDRTDNSIMPDSSSNIVDVTARVYVRAYHRKDGTYVRSHYRRDPR
jgi:hypothetical protein